MRLNPGFYKLRLWVGETFETLNSFERRFDVLINGQKLPQPVQPSRVAGGFARAGIVEIDAVKVEEDGKLEISFNGKPYRSSPAAYGLEVVPVEDHHGNPGLKMEFHALAAREFAPLPETEKTKRIHFFIAGHSGVFHWAIPQTVQRMLAWSHPHLDLNFTEMHAGGKDVEFFANSSRFQKGLTESGDVDYAIVMDSSRGPIEKPRVFEKWMPELITLIQAQGVQPILYAYSGPKRFSVKQRRLLMARYRKAAESAGALVFPCAEALARAEEKFPETNFHNPDQRHVGILTGYLFSAVWYRVLTGQSASELPEHQVLVGHVLLPEKWAEVLSEIADAVCIEQGVAGGILEAGSPQVP
jgi:hypothetical protein